MKKIIFLCMMATAVLCSCSSDDDEDMTQNRPEGDKETMYPVKVQDMTDAEFASFFVGKVWIENAVYDVSSDGTVSDNVIKELAGWSGLLMKVKDGVSAELMFLPSSMPPREENILRKTTTYAYDAKSHKLTFAEEAFDKLQKEYVVVSINDNELRLLGKPLKMNRAKDVAYGIYVYMAEQE